MDMVLDYKKTKEFVEQKGISRFVEVLEHHTKQPYYSCSTAWMQDSKYICKLKGKKGDLIITFNQSNHYF